MLKERWPRSGTNNSAFAWVETANEAASAIKVSPYKKCRTASETPAPSGQRRRDDKKSNQIKVNQTKSNLFPNNFYRPKIKGARATRPAVLPEVSAATANPAPNSNKR